jgi:acyl-coenzyme A thioesterase PaaI-like protein
VADAIYEEHDGAVWATELARGPWHPGAQHGGAPAALLMRAFEQLDDLGADVQIARVTYELLRPVPLGELRVDAAIVRPGRRVQLLEASLFTPDGTEVVRSRAVRVARAPVSAGAGDGPQLSRPEDLTAA